MRLNNTIKNNPIVRTGQNISNTMTGVNATKQLANQIHENIIRWPQQKMIQIANTVQGQESYTPQGGVQKFIYGDKPIGNLQGTNEYTRNVISPYTGKYSKGLAPIITGLGIAGALDPVGGIGSNSTISRVIANADEAGSIIKTLGKAAKYFKPDEINMLVKEKNPAIISEMLSNASRNISGMVKAGQTNKKGLTMANDAAKETQGIVRTAEQNIKRLVANRNIAQTEGAEVAYKFNIPRQQYQQVMDELTGKSPLSNVTIPMRQFLDKAHVIAQDLVTRTGNKINYLDNYLPQMWKNKPEEVVAAFRSLGKTFGPSKNRIIQDYETGIKLGLTPKYENPAQMIGKYYEDLRKTKANLDFFDSLKSNKTISTIREYGSRAINAEGFPEGYYAPTKVAQQIENIFKSYPDNWLKKVLSVTGDIAGKTQDIVLSGGVPKTPINMYATVQGLKNVMHGHVVPPVTSFFRSMSSGKTMKWFAENADVMKRMQARDIDVNTAFNIDNIIDKGWVKNTFGDSLGGVWDNLVSDTTFQRFIPMMQADIYKSIEQAMIRSGKTAQEASRIAAESLKKSEGLMSAAKSAGTDPIWKDATTTVLMAPRYRQALINMWARTVGALKNPLVPENRSSALFATAVVTNYAAFDAINYALNGKHMYENGENNTDKLMIPYGDTTIGIPFLGGALWSVPKTVYKAGKNLVKGDLGEVGKNLRSGLSIAINPMIDVLNNKDYFGNDITNSNDETVDKYKKVGSYLLKQYSHPYMKAYQNYKQGDKLGAAFQALEIPARTYNTNTLKVSELYNSADNYKKNGDLKNNYSMAKDKNGSWSVLVDGYVERVKDEDEGNYKINLSKIKSGEVSSFEYKNNIYYKNDKNVSGYSYYDKDKYADAIDTSKYSLTAERYKRTGNVKAWADVTDKRIKYLVAKLDKLDPATEQDNIYTTLNTINDLIYQMATYSVYKGFTKPKKGKKGKKISIGSAPALKKLTVPKSSSVAPTDTSVRTIKLSVKKLRR
jgi:hypothetical protein